MEQKPTITLIDGSLLFSPPVEARQKKEEASVGLRPGGSGDPLRGRLQGILFLTWSN